MSTDYSDTTFGFRPNLGVSVFFLAMFSLLALIYIGLSSRSWKHWIVLFTLIGAVGEVVGWAGRLLGHNDPGSYNAYLMQICSLTIAPTFFSAACYFMLTRLILSLDVSISRIGPKWFWPIFFAVDVITWILQGIGGGTAGSARDGDRAQVVRGGHIFLAGIAFQQANMLIFCGFAVDYYIRWRRSTKRNPKAVDLAASVPIRILWICLAIASTCIVWRNFFRIVELAEGFDGHLATTERYFATLDGLPILITMVVLIISHPLFTIERLSDTGFVSPTPSQDEKLIAQSTPATGSPAKV